MPLFWKHNARCPPKPSSLSLWCGFGAWGLLWFGWLIPLFNHINQLTLLLNRIPTHLRGALAAALQCASGWALTSPASPFVVSFRVIWFCVVSPLQEKEERYLMLFPNVLVMISASPRMSGFIYQVRHTRPPQTTSTFFFFFNLLWLLLLSGKISSDRYRGNETCGGCGLWPLRLWYRRFALKNKDAFIS